MNVKLLGMSNEELVQWITINSPITERHARSLFVYMELYCATEPVGIYTLTEAVVRYLASGVPWTEIRRRIVRRELICA